MPKVRLDSPHLHTSFSRNLFFPFSLSRWKFSFVRQMSDSSATLSPARRIPERDQMSIHSFCAGAKLKSKGKSCRWKVGLWKELNVVFDSFSDPNYFFIIIRISGWLTVRSSLVFSPRRFVSWRFAKYVNVNVACKMGGWASGLDASSVMRNKICTSHK